MQLQPAVKNFLLALSALGAIGVVSMAQSPVTITPGTSQVFATSGTAALPSVAFAVDPSTGLYRISAGTIGIATTGTTRATVNSSGVNVGSGGMFGFSSAADPATQASDTALTRAGVGQFGWTAVLFANLGAPSNGSFCYCSDCTVANPCASGGTGALAKRLNGAWVCN